MKKSRYYQLIILPAGCSLPPYFNQRLMHLWDCLIQEKSHLKVDNFVIDLTFIVFHRNNVLRLHVHMVNLVLNEFGQSSANL